MSRWSSLKVPVFASAVSLCLGVVLAVAFGGGKSKASPRAKADSAEQAEQPRSQAVAAAAPVAVAVLEARLAALETQVRAPAPSEPAREPDPLPERPTAEEESRQTVATRDAQQQAFDAEGYDPAWSNEARSAFNQDLTTLAQDKNYRVLNVDCKTTLCKATVEWPSYGEVRNTVSDLLYADYHNNCTKMVFAPVPDNQANPYQGTVMYDCTSARAGD